VLILCIETPAFHAESRPLGSFTRCLLSYCKTVVLAIAVVL